MVGALDQDWLGRSRGGVSGGQGGGGSAEDARRDRGSQQGTPDAFNKQTSLLPECQYGRSIEADHPVWALKLGPPSAVEARTTIEGSFLDGGKPNTETYPIAAIIYYEFPARGDLPPVRMTWYDGGLLPPKPVELPDNEQLNKGGGALLIGTKGKLLHDTYGLRPRLLPASEAA